MRKAILKNNRVVGFLELEDPTFPGVPIEDRFSAEILSQCVDCDDDDVRTGWIYEDGVFREPDPIPVDPDNPDYVDPEDPEQRTLVDRVDDLEEKSATKDEVQAVWDSMAAAYSEGVNLA